MWCSPPVARAARARDAWLCHVSSVGGARCRGRAAAGAPVFVNRLLPDQCLTEITARRDIELAEHLVQVVFDGPRADEQLGADLRVRVPVASQPCDLRLLWRQHVARLDVAPARGLAGG